MPKRTAVASAAVLCSADGAVIELLHDELGLAGLLRPGVLLTDVVNVGSAPRVAQLLRTIREQQSAMGYPLEIAFPDKVAPLHFVAHQLDGGILVIAARKPLPSEALVRKLVRLADAASAPSGEQSHRDRPGADCSALIAAAAHGLRNRLNGILAASEYLVEDASPSLQSEQRMLLQSILSSSRTMFRMIDDIVEVVAIETGNEKLDLRPTDILALVKKLSQLNRLSGERKKVRLDLAPAGPLTPVTVDPARASRIVEHLLTNSIAASSTGGRIQIRVEVTDRGAVVSAQVETPALSVDQARLLFQPGRGGPREMAASAGGAAAWIAQRLVEEQGGEIRVESAPGAGLVLTVELRTATAPSPVTPAVRAQRGNDY